MASDEQQDMWAQPGLTPDEPSSFDSASQAGYASFTSNTYPGQIDQNVQAKESNPFSDREYPHKDGYSPTYPSDYGQSNPPGGYDQSTPGLNSPQPEWGIPGMSWAPIPQPGIIPLRPLQLSELFDGSFKAVRANPPVMFGFSLVAMAVISVLGALVQAFFLPSSDYTFSDPQAALNQTDVATQLASQMSGALISGAIPSILSAIGATFVAGFLALSVSDAVLGKVTPLQEAWKRFRPRFWVLFGVSILVDLIGLAIFVVVILLFSIPMFLQTSSDFYPHLSGILLLICGIFLACIIAFAVFAKLFFAPTIVVLENLSPFKAIARSWHLTKGAFWQTIGRYLTIAILTSVASGLLTGVVAFVMAALAFALSPALSVSLSVVITGLISALVLPIISAWTTLMYVDRRMKAENFGPTLQTAALQ